MASAPIDARANTPLHRALANEVEFLRSTGFAIAAEQIATAIDALGHASAERILAELDGGYRSC